MPRKTEQRSRARSRRQDSRLQILSTTRSLLQTQPWATISVDRIMSEVGASRTLFYRSFTDANQVLVALLLEVKADLQNAADRWIESRGRPHDELRAAVASLVDFYVNHGPVLRAAAVAMDDDPEVRCAYRTLADGFIEAAAARFRQDVSAGLSDIRDPDETARALIWLNERYLTLSVPGATLSRLGAIKATLGDIWVRAVYSDHASR